MKERSVSTGDAERFADPGVGAGGQLPVVDAVGRTRHGLAGIGKIRHAKIEVDISDRRTHPAGQRDLGGWLGRLPHAGDRDAGIEQGERRLGGGPYCGPAVGECDPAIDVVGYDPGPRAELERACRAIRGPRGCGFGCGPAATAKADRADRAILRTLGACAGRDQGFKTKKSTGRERARLEAIGLCQRV